MLLLVRTRCHYLGPRGHRGTPDAPIKRAVARLNLPFIELVLIGTIPSCGFRNLGYDETCEWPSWQ